MELTLEREREEDGRWLAELPELPGVLHCGGTEDGALVKADPHGLSFRGQEPD